jgi:hypothetical protein
MNPIRNRGRRLAAFTGDAQILNQLWADPAFKVSGRNGALTFTGGGVNTLHPFTRAVTTGQITHTVPVPGGNKLTLWSGMPAIANLWIAPTATATGVSSSLANVARTVTEDGSTGVHETFSAESVALTNGASYRLYADVQRSTGSRHAVVVLRRTGEAAGMVVDLSTGAITAYTEGGGSATATESYALPGGGWRVACTVSNAAWGGSVATYLGVSESGNSLDVTYAGDSASGVVFDGVTLIAGTLGFFCVGEGATRPRDQNSVVFTDGLTQDEEWLILSFTLYGDGDLNIANQIWLERAGTAYPRMIRTGATSLNVTDTDGSAITDGATRTLPNRLIGHMHRIRRKPGTVEGGFNDAMSGSPTGGGTFTTTAPQFVIGHGTAAGRETCTLSALLWRTGGFSADHIGALKRTWCNAKYLQAAA